MSNPNSKPAAPNSVESIQTIWMRQRDELERELFGGWQPTFSTPPQPQFPQPPVAQRPQARPPQALPVVPETQQPNISASAPPPAQTDDLDAAQAKHAAWLQQANDAAVKERLEHQRRLGQELAQQKQAVQAELNRQRGVVEQELTVREKAWSEQRDKEWATLKHAQEIHEQSVKRLRDELATARVQEREQLLAWKQQLEAEMAETRRLHDHERLKQQHELTRQIEVERERLRQDRADMARQLETERERLRHDRSEQIHLIDAEREKLRHERAEMERLRDVLREKFRREQVVLQSSLQFFEQNLTRVSDELRTNPPSDRVVQELAEATSDPVVRTAPATPAIALSLDQIRERLNQMKQPELKKAA